MTLDTLIAELQRVRAELGTDCQIFVETDTDELAVERVELFQPTFTMKAMVAVRVQAQ